MGCVPRNLRISGPAFSPACWCGHARHGRDYSIVRAGHQSTAFSPCNALLIPSYDQARCTISQRHERPGMDSSNPRSLRSVVVLTYSGCRTTFCVIISPVAMVRSTREAGTNRDKTRCATVVAVGSHCGGRRGTRHSRGPLHVGIGAIRSTRRRRPHGFSAAVAGGVSLENGAVQRCRHALRARLCPAPDGQTSATAA